MKIVLIFFFFFIIGIGTALYYHLSERQLIIHSPISFITGKKTYHPFSIAEAPSQSLKANISEQIGDVKLENRVATSPAILNDIKTITQGERILTGDQSSVILTFTDVLSIRLNAQTELSFNQTLPSNLVFSQPSGIAEYVSTGKSPVSVRTHNIAALISEGSVVIDIDQETGFITFVVSKGTVIVAFNDNDNLSNVVTVKEKQTYIFSDTSRTGRIEG
jgi:hypothetical protein